MGEMLDAYKRSWSCTLESCKQDLHERESWVHVSWLSWDDAKEKVEGDGEIKRFCDSRCLRRWLEAEAIGEMAKRVN